MNGMNINVSREDFVKKPQEERDWMLFEGVAQINNTGCTWARKSKWVFKAYCIAAAAGIVGGAIAIFTKWVCG